METAECFVVLVFPSAEDRSSKAKLGELATRLINELRTACGEAPHMISPDASAICLLAFGEYGRIARAVELARAPDTRLFIARASSPFECTGLATAYTWMKNRQG